jgi:hypothetical protein
MPALSRMRYLVLLGFLCCLAPRALFTVPVHPAAAHASSLSARYSSARYGYSLLIPTGWVRVPNVRWTPGATPADLTVMSPDHQAALGVMVTPIGAMRYSATDLQNVAERLMSQENPLPGVAALVGYTPAAKATIKQQVINHVTFQVVSSELLYGGHMVCFVDMGVEVTQRYHRLYTVAAVVYRSIAGLPPGGEGEPTATPLPGASGASPQRVNPAAMAPSFPTDLAQGFSVQPADSRVGAEPPPLPTDRERGNLCRTPDDGGLTFLDKNCAGALEVTLLVQSMASVRLAPGADDTRPAATVGPDGFGIYVDPSRSAMVRYPVQWTPVSVSSALAAVEAPDRDSLIALYEEQTSSALSQSDLQSIAEQQILDVGRPVFAPTFKTINLDGTSALLALANGVGINTGNTVGEAQVSVIVAVIHQRVVVARAETLLVSNNISIAQVTYPYFTPFTTLARIAVFNFEPTTAVQFSVDQDVGLGYLAVTSLAAL